MVYFAEGGGGVFTTDDLRARVALKEREDPVPLCYCFGFDEADVREEIASTDRNAIPQWIAAMVKQGLCACGTRNPSGYRLRNCVRSVEIAIKSFRSLIVSGIVPIVARGMIEIITRPKTSGTKVLEYSSR